MTLQNIKDKSTNLLGNASKYLTDALDVFKKDESAMTIEEKIEKQHLLNFIYGMGAGIVIYHFMIGALLILGIIWFYNLSLKKTKTLINEQNIENKTPKKRSYKKRKTIEKEKIQKIN